MDASRSGHADHRRALLRPAPPRRRRASPRRRSPQRLPARRIRQGPRPPDFLRELIGADYAHEPLLAPTAEIMDAFRRATASWRRLRASTSGPLLAERSVETALDRADFERPTALLGSEAAAEHCHRRLVVEYLAEHGTSGHGPPEQSPPSRNLSDRRAGVSSLRGRSSTGTTCSFRHAAPRPAEAAAKPGAPAGVPPTLAITHMHPVAAPGARPPADRRAGAYGSGALARQLQRPLDEALEADARRLGGHRQQRGVGEAGDRVDLEHLRADVGAAEHHVDPGEARAAERLPGAEGDVADRAGLARRRARPGRRSGCGRSRSGPRS